MATPKDIIAFKELWKKIALAAGQYNPNEFPFDLFQTTAPLVDVFTFYVDPVLGNDANRGDDSTAPKQTIASALASIPKTVSQPYTINLAAGTYSERVMIEGFNLLGSGSLTINGTMAAVTPTTGNSTGTVASFTVATSAASVQSYITDSGQTLTAHDLKGKFVKFTSGPVSGTYYPIYDNDATNIYLVGAAGMAASNTYAIMDQGSIVSATATGSSSSEGQCQIRNNTSSNVSTIGGTNICGIFINRVKFQNASAGSTSALSVSTTDLLALTNCSVASISTVAVACVATGCAYVNFSRSYIQGMTGASLRALNVTNCGVASFGNNYIKGSSGASSVGTVSFTNVGSVSLTSSAIEKTDTGGTVLYMTGVRAGQAQSYGLFLYNTSGTGSVGLKMGAVTNSEDTATSNFGASVLTIKGCATGVTITSGSTLYLAKATFDTVATTGLSITYGGRIQIPGTALFLTAPTNEILLDGVQKAFTADLDAATPKVLTSAYLSVISR